MINGQHINWDVIFNSIGDAVFVADDNNNILKANAAFARLLNKKVEDIIGKKCYELVHKSKTSWPECPFEKSKKDRKTHIEEVYDPAIGVPLLITTSPIFNSAGEVIGVVHISKEITSLKRAEEALRKQQVALEESEIKYKTMYDSASDAIMMLDPVKGFISGNTATIKLFACDSEKQFMSFSPAELSPDNQPDGSLSSQKAQEMIALALKNGMHSFEWKHKRLNGEEFFASVLLTKMTLKSVTVVQATVRDISEKKKAEEELIQKMAELEQFKKITIGRELKMKELKARVAELEAKIAVTGKD
jgi:PAS domain S-box-containing protein